MPVCPACGLDYPSGKKFCRACGSPLQETQQPPSTPTPTTQTECSACRRPLAPAAKFCRDCGTAVDAAMQASAGTSHSTSASERGGAPDAGLLRDKDVGQTESGVVPESAMPVPSLGSARVDSGTSARSLWIISGAILTVLLVLGLGWYVRGSRSPDASGTDEALLKSPVATELPAAVRGSAEEAALREEQRRRDEDERTAQAQREQQLAQQLEEARGEAERMRLEAERAERRRVDAARAAELKNAQTEVEQRREEAERAAREAAEAAERRRRAEEAVRTTEIPAGTEMNVRLSGSLNSGTASVEDRFEAATFEDLNFNGRTVVPAGSVMRGTVASVDPATRRNRTARMTLAFDLLTINGQAYPIRGTVTQAIAGAGIKGEATKVGGSAGIGAIIGGILGGAKGALAGILIGGGGSIAATKGKQVELSQGTVLRVQIGSRVQIR